jgi:hypothetical protein
MGRNASARREVIELMTHDAKGEVIDAYTSWEWSTLCDEITKLELDLYASKLAVLPLAKRETPEIAPVSEQVFASDLYHPRSKRSDLGGLSVEAVGIDPYCQRYANPTRTLGFPAYRFQRHATRSLTPGPCGTLECSCLPWALVTIWSLTSYRSGSIDH